MVEFDVDMGWNQAHVQILPIDPVKSAKTIKKWQAKAKLMALDDSVVNLPEFQQRVEMAREYLLPKFKSIDAGEMSTRALTTQHAL